MMTDQESGLPNIPEFLSKLFPHEYGNHLCKSLKSRLRENRRIAAYKAYRAWLLLLQERDIPATSMLTTAQSAPDWLVKPDQSRSPATSVSCGRI